MEEDEVQDPFLLKLKNLKEAALKKRQDAKQIKRGENVKKRRAAYKLKKGSVASNTEGTKAKTMSTKKKSFLAHKLKMSNDKEAANLNSKPSGSTMKFTPPEKESVNKSIEMETSTSESSLSAPHNTPKKQIRVTSNTPFKSAKSKSLTDSAKEQRVPKRSRKSKTEVAAAALARKHKQLERIRSDPEKYATFKAVEKERSKKRSAEGKIKKVEDMSARELRNQRKKWRKAYHDSKNQRSLILVGADLAEMNSPPASEIDDAEEIDPPKIVDGRKLRWKKVHAKTNEESQKNINELENQVQHYRKLANCWKASFHLFIKFEKFIIRTEKKIEKLVDFTIHPT